MGLYCLHILEEKSAVLYLLLDVRGICEVVLIMMCLTRWFFLLFKSSVAGIVLTSLQPSVSFVKDTKNKGKQDAVISCHTI